MCLFPSKSMPNTPAYKAGMYEIPCGSCPECLSKRSRLWALRASMEVKNKRPACMITLTYDTFKIDENGNIIGENLAERSVDKKDAQDFLKRLRSHYDNIVMSKIRLEIKTAIRQAFAKHDNTKFKNYRDFRNRYILRAYKDEIEHYKKTEFEKRKISIKYLLTAEYGKRTHRPHYHALIFGVDFKEDRQIYKKSKRNNTIFMSPTLTKLWGNGICTVDCVNVSSKVARYCTKYCAKDLGAEDTFMLVSRGIGDEHLKKEFNGLYYMVEGCEYPIPRLIWNKLIEERIHRNFIYELHLGGFGTYRYRSYKWVCEKYPLYGHWIDLHLRKCRRWFREFKNRQKDYQKYLAYWKQRSQTLEKFQGTSLQRLLALPNDKYFAYKQACLQYLEDKKRRLCGYLEVEAIVPRCNQTQRYMRQLTKYHIFPHIGPHLPAPSRHIRANDIKKLPPTQLSQPCVEEISPSKEYL